MPEKTPLKGRGGSPGVFVLAVTSAGIFHVMRILLNVKTATI
jgi:hypothetical protein